MTRNWFGAIWSDVRFLHQLDARPKEMPSEDCCWVLTQDFIDHFDQHDEQNFHPWATLCVDESMTRWHGIGGDCINEGSPMFVAIDRKPDYGCEIQSICCAKSSVMLSLKVVKKLKSRVRKDASNTDDGDIGLNEGTWTIKELCSSWANTNRVAVTNSHFASV